MEINDAAVTRQTSVSSKDAERLDLRLRHRAARTFPANGTFTSEQATLYNAVLTVQKRLVALCTEASGMSIMQLHWESCTLMRKELERIGFNFPLGAGTLDVLYPHLIGHPVGIGELRTTTLQDLYSWSFALDLHESSQVDRNGPIKEGMVITIEPGMCALPRKSYFVNQLNRCLRALFLRVPPRIPQHRN